MRHTSLLKIIVAGYIKVKHFFDWPKNERSKLKQSLSQMLWYKWHFYRKFWQRNNEYYLILVPKHKSFILLNDVDSLRVQMLPNKRGKNKGCFREKRAATVHFSSLGRLIIHAFWNQDGFWFPFSRSCIFKKWYIWLMCVGICTFGFSTLLSHQKSETLWVFEPFFRDVNNSQFREMCCTMYVQCVAQTNAIFCSYCSTYVNVLRKKAENVLSLIFWRYQELMVVSRPLFWTDAEATFWK